MTTFSQMVDNMIASRKRPDLVADFAMYVNQVIRQVNARPASGSNTQFDENRLEEQFTQTGVAPGLWPIPALGTFNSIEAIYNRTRCQYHMLRKPSVNRLISVNPESRYSWYRTGPYIAIAGGYESDEYDISYFAYPRALAYKAEADRQVIFSQEDQTYLTPTGGTPTEAQLAAETNWVLMRWAPVVEQGVRNAFFTNAGDRERAVPAYSMFEQLRNQLWLEEPSTTLT